MISQVTRKANLLTGRWLETRSEVNGEERVTSGEVWHSKGDKMTQLIPMLNYKMQCQITKKLMTNISKTNIKSQNQCQITNNWCIQGGEPELIILELTIAIYAAVPVVSQHC